MTQRKPLVLANGQVSELQDGDTLEGVASGGLLTEYTDTDPASPAIGEQWVRITTVAPVGTLYSTAMLGMLRRATAYRTAAVKTKTSIGVI